MLGKDVTIAKPVGWGELALTRFEMFRENKKRETALKNLENGRYRSPDRPRQNLHFAFTFLERRVGSELLGSEVVHDKRVHNEEVPNRFYETVRDITNMFGTETS